MSSDTPMGTVLTPFCMVLGNARNTVAEAAVLSIYGVEQRMPFWLYDAKPVVLWPGTAYGGLAPRRRTQ